MYRFFEDLLDPLAPAPVEAPPKRTAAFFGYYLGPIKWLLAATLLISALYSLCELALFWFMGMVIDWMQATGPERFLEQHGTELIWMAVIIGLLRPALMLLARALVTFSITPSLGNRVRWRSHRYVLRQSLSFFQNDFAGRVATEGHADRAWPCVRRSCSRSTEVLLYVAVYWSPVRGGAVRLELDLEADFAPMLLWLDAGLSRDHVLVSSPVLKEISKEQARRPRCPWRSRP